MTTPKSHPTRGLTTPPTSPSPRNAARRAEIAQRAAEVFNRQGVMHTSLEDIAAAVGIRREAVYHYYRDKTEILCEIIQPQSETLLRSMKQLDALELTPSARLALAISKHLERFNPCYVEISVALRELAARNPAYELVELHRIWKDYEQLWIKLFRDGQEAGEFDANQNPKIMAFAVLGMCNAVSGWYRPEGNIPLDELIRSYTAIALRGVTKTKAIPEQAMSIKAQ